MLTIYSDSFAISFSEKVKKVSLNMKNLEVNNLNDISNVVDTLCNDGLNHDINLYGYNSSSIFEDFCSMFKCIDAAGGVVKNIKSEYLLIKRFGIWDLPKGKVETGETMMEAAVREVCEETGLRNVVATGSLPETYHIYYQHKQWFLKKTHWFLMQTSEDTKLIPQADEDISEAVWMNKPDALLALSGSYRSLYDNLGYLFRLEGLA